MVEALDSNRRLFEPAYLLRRPGATKGRPNGVVDGASTLVGTGSPRKRRALRVARAATVRKSFCGATTTCIDIDDDRLFAHADELLALARAAPGESLATSRRCRAPKRSRLTTTQRRARQLIGSVDRRSARHPVSVDDSHHRPRRSSRRRRCCVVKPSVSGARRRCWRSSRCREKEGPRRFVGETVELRCASSLRASHEPSPSQPRPVQRSPLAAWPWTLGSVRTRNLVDIAAIRIAANRSSDGSEWWSWPRALG